MKTFLFFLSCLLIPACVDAQISPSLNGIVYVNAAVVDGAETGSSWSNASKNLKQVITAANTNAGIKEIWVAKGTYYPSATSNRDDFFYITRNDLKVYGGFSGTETSLSERDIQANETILSGNIGAANSADDNSYHIMVIDAYDTAIDNSTQVDGFTFQDGNANAGSVLNYYFPRYNGSAILIYPSIANNSPLIKNNIFRNNSQFQLGALAIEANTSGTNVTRVENCSFYNNYAKYAGGALDVYNHYGTAQDIEIKNCLFEANIVDNASQGGANGGIGAAVFAYGNNNILINRSRFVNNKIGTYNQYPGTYKGTAVAVRSSARVTLVNSLIYSDNIYIPLYNNDGTFNIINSTVYNPNGGTILSTQVPVLNSIKNSILWMGGNSVNTIDGFGTTVTANNSIILPKYNVTLTGSDNYTTDPLFKDVAAKDFTLQTASNGINKGNNSFYDASKYGNSDLLDKSRIEETTIDIGAFELQPTLSALDIVEDKNIVIYPNPVKDILNLKTREKISMVEIISMDGKKVLTRNIVDETKLDLGSLSKGIYFIHISTEKETQSLKFIKE